MTAPVSAMANKIETANARIQRSFRKLMSPLSGFQNALSNVGLYVGGYTIYRVVKGVIDVFADFQQANANLAAIMETTVEKNIALAKEARTLGLSLGVSATEVVGLQMELAKLGYSQEEILKMGPSILSGSVALDASIERTALLVGAITRNWDVFSKTGSDSGKIVDMLSKAAIASALDFTKLETALRQSAPAANAAGVSYAETLAILEALSNSNIDASQSGTALRNILIESGRKGHTWTQVIQNILKHQNLLTAANDKFGKRTAVSGVVLAKHLGDVKKWAQELENVKPGYAMDIVLKKLDTVKGSWKLATAAWDEFILSIEDGNGPIAKNLQTMIQVAGAMFLLGADTDASRTALKKLRPEVVAMAERMNFWVGILKDAAIALLIVQGLIWTLTAATGLLKTATWLMTTAQLALNAAFWANPITLIVLAIVGMIAVVASVVHWFDTWGAAVSLLAMLFLPVWDVILGIVSLVKSFGRNWDAITTAFRSGEVLNGFKLIGAAILDFVLMPLQQVLKIISDLTGFEWAQKAMKSVEGFRAKIGVNTTVAETPTAQGENQAVDLRNTFNNEMKHSLEIQIKDGSNGKAVVTPSKGMKEYIPIVATSTNTDWWSFAGFSN